MSSDQYDVRQAWVNFKIAAFREQGTFPPVEGVMVAAIEKWASYEAGSPGGASRSEREALSQSVGAALLVDYAIEKLASQGRYNDEEKELLLNLNAEAAVTDLRQLLKISSAFSDALASPRLPMAVGALGGALVGGSVGAMKDEDHPVRGALLYGAPGAVIGGLAGHGYGQWSKVRHEARAAQAQKILADQAHAADAASQAAAKAAIPLAQQAQALETAKRWHQNLFDAADMLEKHPDKLTKEYAKYLKGVIHQHADHIIQHAAKNPESVPKILIQEAGVESGANILNQILAQARTFHKNGN